MKLRELRLLIVSIFIVFSIFTEALAQRQYFDKSKDLLLAQFDLMPDEDDILAAAALACMLQHSDLAGINYYAVAGAYGDQNEKFITAGIPDYYNLLFGEQNTNWTDAHNDWSGSVTRIKGKVKTVLDEGGKVFVQEAGQSDITHDVCIALINDGVDAATIKTKIIIVQHSDWNENSATDSKLSWVMSNTDYVKIEDGNGTNATPNYNTSNTTWMNQAKASDNPNANARDYWTAADEICENWTASWENPAIAGGGVDFSDCSENWYIFDIGSDAWTIEQFWKRYVTNETGSLKLSSYDDFPDYNISGFKPAYKDNDRHCLAIDASQYKGEFAAAQTTYQGESGKFNIKINTLLEYDGESTYNLKVNGTLIGTFQNPRTTEAGDLTPSSSTFEKIDLETGDIIQVEFNSHSNGLIPEGDGFAYSRGRWRSIELINLH